MKFNKTITISVGTSVKELFEKFEKMRPNDISFSMFIACAMNEYMRNNDKVNSKITDFDNKSVEAKTPLFLASIDKWKECISGMSGADFKKLQQRHSQLGNIISGEVAKRI